MTDDVELRNVTVVTDMDPEPPLDHLGHYTNEPGPEDRTIDRSERGDMGRGEFQYFIAAHSGEETGNPDSVEEDYERMEALIRGEWQVLNVKAQATIQVGNSVQSVDVPPIGGVASDGPDDYLEEIATERLKQIEELLGILGVEWDGTAKWGEDAPLSGEIKLE